MEGAMRSTFINAIKLASRNARNTNAGNRVQCLPQMVVRSYIRSSLPPSSINFTIAGCCSSNLVSRSQPPLLQVLAACNICRGQSSSASISRAEVQDRVMAALKKFDKIDASKLSVETHLMKDLGLDSLDHVEMLMAIEDEFAIEIPEDEGEKLIYPKDIVGFVQKMMQADDIRKA